MTLKPSIRTGMPPDTKPRPRSDFDPAEFDQLIGTKGYWVWWSRAAPCPCDSPSDTDQPSPICKLCGGGGWLYFKPDPLAIDGGEDDSGNAVEVSTDGKAIKIYCAMTSMTQDTQVFEKFGSWVFGMAKASVQPQNRLGYRDRLTAVNSVMSWAQRVRVDGSAAIGVVGKYKGRYPDSPGLRYALLDVNLLRNLTTEYVRNTDFELLTDGTIKWLTTPPADGTILTLHGTVHPQWIVLDLLHVYRDTWVQGPAADLESQQLRNLPMQAAVKLEFLTDD